jgi:hypothetical protein
MNGLNLTLLRILLVLILVTDCCLMSIEQYFNYIHEKKKLQTLNEVQVYIKRRDIQTFLLLQTKEEIIDRIEQSYLSMDNQRPFVAKFYSLGAGIH